MRPKSSGFNLVRDEVGINNSKPALSKEIGLRYGLLGQSLRSAACASRTFFRFLLVQAGSDFFGVAVVVEGQEAVEDFASGGGREGEAETLFGFVKVVAETGPVILRKIGPPVRGGDGPVELAV